MAWLLLCLVPLTALADDAVVTELSSRDLPEARGREVVMLRVEYPPGAADAVHRHNAHAFVYVLEGSIVMQLEGGKPVTLKAGETFYEGPDDVHLVGRNASDSHAASFLVFMVKKKRAPVLELVK
jgi:quercetin dioxygenase-like cupin family protein